MFLLCYIVVRILVIVKEWANKSNCSLLLVISVVLIWKSSLQLPLMGPSVVHLSDTARERYGISVVVGIVMVGLGRIWSYHIQHCLHFLIFLRKLQESKNPCNWFSKSGKRYIFQRKDLKCVCDITFFHVWLPLHFVPRPTCPDPCFYVAWWDNILWVRLYVSRARNTSVYSSVPFFHPKEDSLNWPCLHKYGLQFIWLLLLGGFCWFPSWLPR